MFLHLLPSKPQIVHTSEHGVEFQILFNVLPTLYAVIHLDRYVLCCYIIIAW